MHFVCVLLEKPIYSFQSDVVLIFLIIKSKAFFSSLISYLKTHHKFYLKATITSKNHLCILFIAKGRITTYMFVLSNLLIYQQSKVNFLH
jgi:hypothetical protein